MNAIGRWQGFDFICTCGRQRMVASTQIFVTCSHCGDTHRKHTDFLGVERWFSGVPLEHDRALSSGTLAR